MLHALLFALQITLPNILLMVLGFVMQRRQAVNQNFVEVASSMVFQYCLPCLLFFSIIKSDIHVGEQLTLLTAGLVTTFTLFFAGELYAYFFVPEKRDKGVFVQGVFRSNMAIMGLATVANAYGDKGMSVGAVYMGIITIVYNILSVITLSRSDAPKGSFWHASLCAARNCNGCNNNCGRVGPCSSAFCPARRSHCSLPS